MGLAKVDNTYHGNLRLKERTTLKKNVRKQFVKEASRAGKAYQNLPYGPLRDYVQSKGTYKRVRYYQGYIFIFQNNSTSLITLYPVPSEILEAQQQFDKAKED